MSRIIQPGGGGLVLPSPGMPAPGTGSEPVLLTASGVIQSSSGATLNTQALTNPLKVPIEIQEIRWQVSDPSEDNTVNGLSVACQLTYGPLALTNGYIPVWNFGRMYNQYEDFADYHEYRWRLQSPLFVAPGGLVEPKFQHLGLVKEALNVRISYLGRTVPKHRPKSIQVPYVAAYLSDSINVRAADATTESKETDLQNALDATIQVDRYVGRLNLYSLDEEEGTVTNTDHSALVFDVAQFLTLEMSDSDGYKNIMPDTLFWEAFNPQFRCWDVQHSLQAGGFYLVKLAYDGALISSLAEDVFGPSSIRASISMVGHREVKTS